jgi:hypothetical protein
MPDVRCTHELMRNREVQARSPANESTIPGRSPAGRVVEAMNLVLAPRQRCHGLNCSCPCRSCRAVVLHTCVSCRITRAGRNRFTQDSSPANSPVLPCSEDQALWQRRNISASAYTPGCQSVTKIAILRRFAIANSEGQGGYRSKRCDDIGASVVLMANERTRAAIPAVKRLSMLLV